MAVINSRKFAGYTIGQIVPDAEFDAKREKYRRMREDAYEAAVASGHEAGASKWVVGGSYTVNGRTMPRGTVFYTTMVDGNGDYRLQRTKSRQTVFATDSMRNIREHATRI